MHIIKRKFSNISSILIYAIKNTICHDGMEFAGYLAYLWLLALFPFLFIYTAILSYVTMLIFDSALYYNITQRVITIFDNNLPENIVHGIMPFIQEVLLGPPQSLLTIAILSAIWVASSAVEGMRTIFNRAYNIQKSPKYIFGRMMSIIQLLFITAISVLLLIFITVVPLFQNIFLLSPLIESSYWNYLYSMVTLLSVVCWLYIMIPTGKQSLKSVLPGAIIVVFLWIVSASLFSIYIKSFAQINMIYGGLTGVIFVLTFFYIMNLCLIFGAELNHALVHFKKI